MTLSTERSNVARLEKQLAGLRKKDADEIKKEANTSQKLHRAFEAAERTTSTSTAAMKLREAERHQNDLARISAQRSRIASDIHRKTEELFRAKKRLDDAESKVRKAEIEQAKKLNKKLQDEREKISASIKEIAPRSHIHDLNSSLQKQYDVFISHATEDKESFVRPFANVLKEKGLAVWYDEHSLKWGDSLRREIEKGLANSKFGVVILSENFFKKEWPQTELDALINREISGETRVLPIWHQITKDQVLRASPILANKLALNTSLQTMDEIVDELLRLCRPDLINDDF